MGRQLLYRSSYLNSTVAVRTADRGLVGLVAGKHERHFPYFHEQSEWDNLLLHVDGVDYAYSTRDIAALRMELDEHQARIAFAGELRGRDEQPHSVDLELVFALEPGDMYPQGRIWDWSFLPGMRWWPFFLALTPEHSRLIIDGCALALQRGCGELERGEMTNLTLRSFAFRYDYCCLAAPDADYVTIDFATRALTRRTVLERIIDRYLRRTAQLELNLGPGSAPGQPACEPPGDVEVLVEDRVNLGLAWLDRQLVRTRDARGHTLVGLREIFHPRAAALPDRRPKAQAP